VTRSSSAIDHDAVLGGPDDLAHRGLCVADVDVDGVLLDRDRVHGTAEQVRRVGEAVEGVELEQVDGRDGEGKSDIAVVAHRDERQSGRGHAEYVESFFAVQADGVPESRRHRDVQVRIGGMQRGAAGRAFGRDHPGVRGFGHPLAGYAGHAPGRQVFEPGDHLRRSVVAGGAPGFGQALDQGGRVPGLVVRQRQHVRKGPRTRRTSQKHQPRRQVAALEAAIDAVDVGLQQALGLGGQQRRLELDAAGEAEAVMQSVAVQGAGADLRRQFAPGDRAQQLHLEAALGRVQPAQGAHRVGVGVGVDSWNASSVEADLHRRIQPGKRIAAVCVQHRAGEVPAAAEPGGHEQQYEGDAAGDQQTLQRKSAHRSSVRLVEGADYAHRRCRGGRLSASPSFGNEG
jgi:hypothetical protein